MDARRAALIAAAGGLGAPAARLLAEDDDWQVMLAETTGVDFASPAAVSGFVADYLSGEPGALQMTVNVFETAAGAESDSGAGALVRLITDPALERTTAHRFSSAALTASALGVADAESAEDLWRNHSERVGLH